MQFNSDSNINPEIYRKDIAKQPETKRTKNARKSHMVVSIYAAHVHTHKCTSYRLSHVSIIICAQMHAYTFTHMHVNSQKSSGWAGKGCPAQGHVEARSG